MHADFLRWTAHYLVFLRAGFDEEEWNSTLTQGDGIGLHRQEGI